MITACSKVVICRNGHKDSIGYVCTHTNKDIVVVCNKDENRGLMRFSQKTLHRNDQMGNVHDGLYTVAVVDNIEWLRLAEEIGDLFFVERANEAIQRGMKWQKNFDLAEKAETWYNSLPENERDLVDSLVQTRTPIAVA